MRLFICLLFLLSSLSSFADDSVKDLYQSLVKIGASKKCFKNMCIVHVQKVACKESFRDGFGVPSCKMNDVQNADTFYAKGSLALDLIQALTSNNIYPKNEDGILNTKVSNIECSYTKKRKSYKCAATLSLPYKKIEGGEDLLENLYDSFYRVGVKENCIDGDCSFYVSGVDCRESDIDVDSEPSCKFNDIFGRVTSEIEGDDAHYITVAMQDLGIQAEGAAGTFFTSIDAIKCTVFDTDDGVDMYTKCEATTELPVLDIQ